MKQKQRKCVFVPIDRFWEVVHTTWYNSRGKKTPMCLPLTMERMLPHKNSV